MNKRYMLGALALSMALGGCSHMPSWLGGEKKEKPKLAGERIAVLPVGAELQPDPTLQKVAMTLPAPAANADWPQHTGVVNAAAGNLAAAGHFEHESHAEAGKGEEFDHTLVPRPVVGGGQVFAMDAAGNISAHDAADVRKVNWQSKGVAEKHAPEILGGGLAFDQGKLYAASGCGTVIALDAATGKELWRKALRVPFRSAPRVAGDKLFALTIDNQVFALNTATGEVVWSQRGIDETAQLMNAVSPTVTDDTLIVPYSSGEVYALATGDGKEQWSESLTAGKRTQASAFFSGIGGDPVVDGSVIFAVSGGGLLSVLTLTDGHHLWDRPVGSINTPWVAGDYMFLLTTDNTLVCFVKYTGTIRWSMQLKNYENQKDKKKPITWRGPVLVNGNLVVTGSDGELLLVSATEGKIVSTQEIPEGIYTPPVVAGGRMYLIGQDARLYELQ